MNRSSFVSKLFTPVITLLVLAYFGYQIYGYVSDPFSTTLAYTYQVEDTVDISTMDTDPAKVPGVLIDDSVRVVCAGKDVDGVKVLTAQELTVTVHSPYYYIQGTWLEPNPIKASEMQGVTLEADGSAVSVGMATLQLKNWSLADGKVMLTAESIGNGVNAETTDTLQVVKLDADSLVLAQNGQVVWRFGRKK